MEMAAGGEGAAGSGRGASDEAAADDDDDDDEPTFTPRAASYHRTQDQAPPPGGRVAVRAAQKEASAHVVLPGPLLPLLSLPPLLLQLLLQHGGAGVGLGLREQRRGGLTFHGGQQKVSRRRADGVYTEVFCSGSKPPAGV